MGQLARDIHQGPLYEQVAKRLGAMVEDGTFQPGDRVPSLRKLAQQFKVSLNTVKEAYTFLEARRIIEARPQSGYYVCRRLPAVPQTPAFSPSQLHPTQVSSSELVTMILKSMLDPSLIQLGAAVPHLSNLPIEQLTRSMNRAIRQHSDQSIAYALTPGVESLRQQVARHMIQAGCSLHPDEILITAGCSEAIYLALRTVLKPGDTIALESPIYFNFLQMIHDLQLNAVEIPSTPNEGMSIEALRYALDQTPIQAVLAIANHTNPIGSRIPDSRKKELVQLLAERQIPLIEDDTNGDLSFEDERPSVCKAFDTSGNVLLCSSFSKTIAPGYRVGWIAAGRYQAQIDKRKLTTNYATPAPTQLAVADFLAQGQYDRHLRKLRRVYARNVAQMAEAIGKHFPAGTRITRPSGGYTLWVELPTAFKSLDLYAHAIQHGITIAPGPIFSASGRFPNYVRLSAAHWDLRVEEAIARLGHLLQGQQA